MWKSGLLWILKSLKYSQGPFNSELVLPCMLPLWYKSQPHILFPEINLLKMCSREEIVDLRHSVISLHLYAISWFLFIDSLPSPFLFLCSTFLLDTKQNLSYYHIQGILSSTFTVSTSSPLLPCRSHQKKLSNKDSSSLRGILISVINSHY